MELRHLRYFVSVAEEANLTRAAAKLHITQPALSRQIRDLEKFLQVELFERTPTGVKLTCAGRIFHSKALAILEQSSEAAHEARAAASGVSMSLAIGYPSSIMLNFLVPLINRFRVDYPACQIDFVHVRGPEQATALHMASIDVAFGYLPFHDAEHFEFLTLSRVPFKVVLPQHHPLAQVRSLKLSDLRHEDMVFSPRALRPEFYDRFFQACAAAGFRPRIVKEVGGHLTNVLGLVSVGLGISVLPYFHQMERIDGIVWRPLLAPRTMIDLALVWRSERASPSMNAFLSVARSLYQDAQLRLT